MSLVFCLNKFTSEEKEAMYLLRILVEELMIQNIIIHAEHIPGVENSKCDALSRDKLQEFRDLHPTAALAPTPLPLRPSQEILLGNAMASSKRQKHATR